MICSQMSNITDVDPYDSFLWFSRSFLCNCNVIQAFLRGRNFLFINFFTIHICSIFLECNTLLVFVDQVTNRMGVNKLQKSGIRQGLIANYSNNCLVVNELFFALTFSLVNLQLYVNVDFIANLCQHFQVSGK